MKDKLNIYGREIRARLGLTLFGRFLGIDLHDLFSKVRFNDDTVYIRQTIGSIDNLEIGNLRVDVHDGLFSGSIRYDFFGGGNREFIVSTTTGPVFNDGDGISVLQNNDGTRDVRVAIKVKPGTTVDVDGTRKGIRRGDINIIIDR